METTIFELCKEFLNSKEIEERLKRNQILLNGEEISKVDKIQIEGGFWELEDFIFELLNSDNESFNFEKWMLTELRIVMPDKIDFLFGPFDLECVNHFNNLNTELGSVFRFFSGFHLLRISKKEAFVFMI